MFRFTFFLICIFFICNGFSQQIKGKVLSKKNNTGIVNIAIKTDSNYGTVTNEKGEFSLNISNANSLIFSSLIYNTKKIAIQDLKQVNFIVYLEENINLLDEIKITTSPIPLDSILSNTQKNMCINFVVEDSLQQQFYSYSQQIIKPTKSYEAVLKKTNLLNRKQTKLAKAELDSLVKKYADKPGSITEEFYVEKEPAFLVDKKTGKKNKATKINSITGFKNNFIDASVSVDEIDEVFKNTLLKYLDTTKSYTVKTGLFTIGKDISFQKISNIKDSVENDINFLASYGLLKHNESQIAITFFLKENAQNFLSKKYYNHSNNKSVYSKNRKFYSVSFSPRKRKSKFVGKMLIDANNFTIAKVTYSYAENKGGYHLNLKFLLGVKYSENSKEINIHYDTTDGDNVFVKYFKENKKSYAYISRPLTFIENKNWFKKKDKVKIDLTLEVNNTESKELFYETPKILKEKNFKEITKKELNKKIPFLNKQAYNKTEWSNKKLIKNYLLKNN